MLTIRGEQMNAFGDHAVRAFDERMARHLRVMYPERTARVGQDKLLGAVRAGREKAAGYGVVLEDDVQRFLELMTVYGRSMDKRPKTRWIGDILRDPTLTGSAKIDRIDEYDLFLTLSRR